MTIGQKRVSLNFNPSGDDIVDQIKTKSSELIDLCESMKAVGDHDAKLNAEKNRLITLAQTNFEIASMFAVKANFA